MAGKKLAEAAAKVDRTRLYPPYEALELAKETNPTRFDATVEVAYRLGVDPRRADQMGRPQPARHPGPRRRLAARPCRRVAHAARDRLAARLVGAAAAGAGAR